MGFEILDNGDLTITQGDSFELVLNGIPTDQNYKIYFAIQNKDREPIGQEIMVESNLAESVVIKVVGNYTDLLTVEEDSKYATYYYGVKKCSDVDNTEDTLLLGNKKLGELNTIKVFPRKVKGI
jgi:hypothetical protein